MAGVQFYYDSKAASESSAEEESGEGHGHRRGNEVFDNATEGDMGSPATTLPHLVLTEHDLEVYKKVQESSQEEKHADKAITIALTRGMFAMATMFCPSNVPSYQFATGHDRLQLALWQAAMKSMVATAHIPGVCVEGDEADACAIEALRALEDMGETALLADHGLGEGGVEPLQLVNLPPEQRWAYDIIDMHWQHYLSGGKLPQLRMFIPGEAGVGKSMTVQTITANFICRGVSAILVKGAYTGIAASAINRKTLHFIAMIPLNGGAQSAQMIQALETYWHDKQYLIIDEISMVSREMFAKLSNIIG